jgi:hypothetical protein
LDSLRAILSLESLVVFLAAIVAMWVIGFMFGRAGRRDLIAEQERLKQAVTRAERQSSDQSRQTIAEMRRELDTVANLALALPRVVRDLNRDDVEPAEVPRLILRLADAVFEPKQVLLYGIRPVEGSKTERVLHLSLHRGIDSLPEALYRSKRDGRNRVSLHQGTDIGDPGDLSAVIDEFVKGDPSLGTRR